VVTPAPAAAAPNQQTPLTPTGNPAADNRVFGAAGGSTNRTGIALRDQSVTEADRALLQNLRQLVVPRLEAMGAWGQAVHFWVRDGLVTLVGTVQSPEMRQEAGRMVEQIPGVVKVEDRLCVGTGYKNASDVDQALAY